MNSLFNRRFIESVRACTFKRMAEDYARPVMSTAVLVGTRNKYRAEIDCGNGNLYDVDVNGGKVRETEEERDLFTVYYQSQRFTTYTELYYLLIVTYIHRELYRWLPAASFGGRIFWLKEDIRTSMRTM